MDALVVAAPSIGALVRRATRRARLKVAVEGALGGLAVAAAVATLVRLGGADELARGALAAAALAGLAAAATWWLEHRPSAASIARRVDLALERGGELVTAWELESREERGVLEELMLLRARERVEPRAVARSVPPPSLVFAGAALLALAGLLFARERVAVRAPDELQRLAAEARALASAAGVGTRAPAELERSRAAAARLAARLAEERAAPRDPARPAELAADLAGALERMAGSEADPERAAGARELAERVRRLGGAREAPAGGAGALPKGADSASALANGGTDRTMLRPGSAADAAGEAPPGAGAAPTSAPETAAASFPARWWSARHDAVVSAWIDACRSRAARDPNEDDAK